MGYNKANYARIRAEYDKKYLLAQDAAEAKKHELQMKIPGLWELDREIARAGSEIMGAVLTAKSQEERAEMIERAKEKNRALQEKRARLLLESGYPADYTDVKYVCDLCGDTGYVNMKMCSCMSRELILAGYESSGIGNLLREQTFDSFSFDYFRSNPMALASAKYIFDTLHTFAEQFSDKKSENFLLIGGTGRGKTHLSSATAGRVIERGYDVYYISAVNLFRDFEKMQFGRGVGDSEDIARCFECDLLIIDDLGTELTNQFTVSVLYDIIDTRINSKKSTIISTNLSHAELRKRYWDRVTSRLFGEYKPLRFEGADIREWKIREMQEKP
ncbi:MAG: ATP-binding protein [Clostridia bacterium]|nr:ATP-binding protein [Clostridia bacterium]